MAFGSAIRAGKAAIELFLDDDKFQKQLNQVRVRLASFGRSLRGIGAEVGGLGAALSAPFLLAIKAASDFQETASKFGVVFGERAKDVEKFADALAAQLGRGKGEIRSFLAASQDLFVPLGFDSSEGEKLSKTLVQLAIDLASFNNVADADAMRDLQAALTGSGEVMKKYGVIVSEAAVKQELFSRGIKSDAATEQEKVLSRLNLILKGTSAAQGDAVRTSDGFANQLKRAQGIIQDISASIGAALLPSLSQLLAGFGNAARGFEIFAGENQATVQAIALTGAALAGIGIAVGGAGIAFSGLASIVGALTSAFFGLTGAIGAAATGLAAIATGSASIVGTLGGIAAGIAVVSLATADWTKLFQDLGNVATDTIDGISAAIKSGKIELAGEIAFEGLKLSALKTLNEISSAFFRTFSLENLLIPDQSALPEGLRRNLKNLPKSELFDVKPTQDRLAELKKQADEAVASLNKVQAEKKEITNPSANAAPAPAVRAAKEDFKKTDKELQRAKDFIKGVDTQKQRLAERLRDEAEEFRSIIESPRDKLDKQLDRLDDLRRANLITEDERAAIGKKLNADFLNQFKESVKEIRTRFDTGPILTGGDLSSGRTLGVVGNFAQKQLSEAQVQTKVLQRIEKNTQAKGLNLAFK